MKGKLLFLLVCVVALFSSCQQKKAEFNVGWITTTAGLGDGSLNDAIVEGLDQIVAEKGESVLTFSYTTPNTLSDYESIVKDYAASKDYDLIIGTAFEMFKPMSEVAALYPEQKFLIIDQRANEEYPNMAGLWFEQNHQNFLSGIFASYMLNHPDDFPGISAEGVAEGKVVASIMGIELPNLLDGGTGYEAGALLYDNTFSDGTLIYKNYVANTFGDPEKGKNLAKTAISADGVDSFIGMAAATSRGMYTFLGTIPLYSINMDSSKARETFKETIIATGRKGTLPALKKNVYSLLDGTWEGGTRNHTFADGVGEFIFSEHMEIPQEARDFMEEMRILLNDGVVEIPYHVDYKRAESNQRDLTPWLDEYVPVMREHFGVNGGE